MSLSKLPASPVPSALLETWQRRGLVGPQVLSTVLDGSARRWPDAPALVDLTERGRSLTYAELAQRATQLVGHWRSKGVSPGDPVLLVSPNCAELVAAVWAGFWGGQVVMPVVEIYRQHELRQLVTQVKPAAAVVAVEDRGTSLVELVDDAFEHAGVDCRSRVSLRGDNPAWVSFEEATSTASAAGPLARPSVDAPSLILFTSGTSAAPKGVVHSSSTLLAEVRQQVHAKGLGWATRGYVGVTLAHLAGLLNAVLIPGTIGSTVVLSRSGSLSRAAGEILEYEVTDASGPTTLLKEVLSQWDDAPGIPLRNWWTGGMAPDSRILERADDLGLSPFRTYGLTEFPTVTQGSSRDARRLRLETDGPLAPGVECQAVDDQRLPLPLGEEGELRVRGPERMLGYLDTTSNENALDEDGWFYTGDLGTVDEQSCVTITGRIKDIINRGGEKFSARDIENVIRRHEAVSRASVLPAPDSRYGEVPVAFLERRGDSGETSDAALTEFLLEQGLASQKIPTRWYWVDALPETSLGKVQKRDLRAMLTEEES